MKIKHHHTILTVLSVIILLWVSACSSLPKKIESRTMTFAAMKMRLAQEAQKGKDFLRAARLFGEAYDDFTRIDDIKGKIDSGLSIARQYFYLGKLKESKEWLKRASELMDGNFSYMQASRSLLMIEMAFEKMDYKEVIRVAGTVATENEQWNLEVLCYAMVSRMHLNLDYSADLVELDLSLPRLHKRFKKHKLEDPEVLSLAYYYKGYIHVKKKMWQSALTALENARSIDTTLDNSYGLAKDLFLMGRCYREMAMTTKAISCYTRSAEIFLLIKEPDMAKRSQAKVKSLQVLLEKR